MDQVAVRHVGAVPGDEVPPTPDAVHPRWPDGLPERGHKHRVHLARPSTRGVPDIRPRGTEKVRHRPAQQHQESCIEQGHPVAEAGVRAFEMKFSSFKP